MDNVAAIECERSVDRVLRRTSHLFADEATLRDAGSAAAGICGDVAGRYVAVVVALAVAYAHADPVHDQAAARELIEAAHREPAMLDEARTQLGDLDVLATQVRLRAQRLLRLAGDRDELTGRALATG